MRMSARTMCVGLREPIAVVRPTLTTVDPRFPNGEGTIFLMAFKPLIRMVKIVTHQDAPTAYAPSSGCYVGVGRGHAERTPSPAPRIGENGQSAAHRYRQFARHLYGAATPRRTPPHRGLAAQISPAHCTSRFGTLDRREYRSAPTFLPRNPNRLIPVGIPNPLLHNPLNSFAITRTTP